MPFPVLRRHTQRRGGQQDQTGRAAEGRVPKRGKAPGRDSLQGRQGKQQRKAIAGKKCLYLCMAAVYPYKTGRRFSARRGKAEEGGQKRRSGMQNTGEKEEKMIRHGCSVPVLRGACALVVLCLLAAFLWPVDVLEIRRVSSKETEEGLLFAVPVPLGHDVRTRMIHSVQQTPVEDVYRIQEGRIWNWQERVMSHNAGLPSLSPPRGRFFSDPPWMVFEGGGASWPALLYRVGNEELGRNICFLPFGRELPLWRLVPDERLRFQAVRLPLHRVLACF